MDNESLPIFTLLNFFDEIIDRFIAKEKEIYSAAQDAAGNWKKFKSFYWRNEPEENSNDWAIFYTSNRDSDISEQSNAAAIEKIMETFCQEDDNGNFDCVRESHNHWAVGYVDGFAIKVFADDNGAITPAFRTWCGIQSRLEDYSILDEDDFSLREYEATIENIENVGTCYLGDKEELNITDNWAAKCFSWFGEHDSSAIECRDGNGGYPTSKEMKACLNALGWLDEDDEQEAT